MLTPLVNLVTVDLILHWVPPFIFAAIGVFLFWKTRPEHWPDFKKWDQKQEFELYEAACLWFDREPVLPMPRNAQEKYQEWKQMILENRLSVTGPTTRNHIEIAMKKETAINPHLIVYRDKLKEHAIVNNVEPRFLFPYRRGEE